MPRWKSNQGRRRLPFCWLLLPAFWWNAPSLSAQALPLKSDAPGVGPYACPTMAVPSPPGEEERLQARELASTAAQSLILGDLERARALLDRATELDPSSADLAYRHARVLEDMGERQAAIAEFCRVLTVDPQAEGVDDARERIETLAGNRDAPYPPDAVAEFQNAVEWAQAGLLQNALASFGTILDAAPDWPEVVYDRGVIADRLGRSSDAVRDYRRYLELRPGASDAVAVSQRLGELQSAMMVSTPSPGTALALGIILPGMGQFYSGRALGGLTVLALAGGAAATGYFVTDVNVKCLSDPGPDGSCPEGQVLSEQKDHPYLVAGVGAAAAIGVIGAVEAFVKLRRLRRSGSADPGAPSVQVGGARVSTLDVTASQGRVELRLVRLAF